MGIQVEESEDTIEIEIDLGDVCTEGKTIGDNQGGKKKGWSLPFAAPRPKTNSATQKPQDAVACPEKPAMQPQAEHREASKLGGCSGGDQEETAAAQQQQGNVKTIPQSRPAYVPRGFRCPSRLGGFKAAASAKVDPGILQDYSDHRDRRAVHQSNDPADTRTEGHHMTHDFGGDAAAAASCQRDMEKTLPSASCEPTASKAADSPLPTCGAGNLETGMSSARRRKSQGRKLRPPLKKAFTREEADPVQRNNVAATRDKEPSSDYDEEQILDSQEENISGMADNPFVSARSRAKNERFKQELQQRVERQQVSNSTHPELGNLMQRFHMQPPSGLDDTIDLTEDGPRLRASPGLEQVEDEEDEDMSCLEDSRRSRQRNEGIQQSDGHWQRSEASGRTHVQEEGPSQWWLRFPDFVPLSELKRGLNPRTGSVVYIDYKAQFQEEAPGSAPQRRKAANARAKKGKQSDTGKKANKAYFARRGGFKRRR